MGAVRMTLLAIAAGVVLGGPAHAAAFSYVSNSTGVAANTADDVSVPCPAGTKVVGGGVFMSGSSLETEVRSSAPFDGQSDPDRRPDDGWSGIGNAGPSLETITGFGICGDGLRLRYVKASRQVTARSAAKAHCPDGTRVIGGGVATARGNPSTLIRLVRSHHLGAGDPDKDNDGWVGSVDNASAQKVRMTTWAVCARRVAVQLQTVTASGFLTGTQSYTQTASCFGDGVQLTGGGGVVPGAPGGTEIASLEPRSTDPDGIRDDAWRNWFNNESGATQQMSAFAICTKVK